MVRAPLHFHGRIPVPEVAPLTYRDGVSQLELVYEISEYLKKILHPSLQSTVNKVVADAERLLSDATAQYVDGVQEFQRIHDAFMSDVNASLVALNDSAASDLVDDHTSMLYQILRRNFAEVHRLENIALNAADFGAVSGSPDSTRGIQDAIDYAHSQGINRVIVQGTHFIQAHLDGDTSGGVPYFRDKPLYQGGVELRSNITLDLRNATIHVIPNASQRYSALRVEHVENVTVLGGILIGDRDHHQDQLGEHGMGIYVINSSNVYIKGTQIFDMWGDGIYIGGESGRPYEYNTNIYVHDVHSEHNRRQGMSITVGKNIITTGSTFTKTQGILPQSGVDIEPNSPDTVCENIVFRDCHFTDNEVYGLTGTGTNIDGVLVENCVASSNRVTSPVTGHPSPENGQIRLVNGADNITIRNTRVEHSIGSIGLELRALRVKVDSSEIDARVYLRSVDEASQFHIQNNTLHDNFRIVGQGHFVLTGNVVDTVADTRDHFFGLGDSVVHISNNTFTTSEHVVLEASSNQATWIVSDNTFHGYPEYAIHIRPSESSTIRGNTFIQSEHDTSYAIYLSGGTSNTVVTDNVHMGRGALTRSAGALHNVYIAGNVSPLSIGSTPSSANSTNVWLQYSPVSWWHDGETIELGG